MARQVAGAHRAEEAVKQAQAEVAHYSGQVQALQASCCDYAQSTAAQADKLNQVPTMLLLPLPCLKAANQIASCHWK